MNTWLRWIRFCTVLLCACQDLDHDGITGSADCDDTNEAVHKGAVEVCDGVDNDCDGLIDEDVAVVAYWDRDRDGYGDTDFARRVCTLPADGSLVGGDCNDDSPAIHPDAMEACDQVDNNCNGEVDEGVTGSFFEDHDGDGSGAGTGISTDTCWPPPGYSTANDDCDDANPAVSPHAPELCDQLDNDCDHEIDEDLSVQQLWVDADGDGAGDPAHTGLRCGPGAGLVNNDRDCDDTDPSRGPFSVDVQGNGIDEDCDGYVDEYGIPSGWPTLDDALAAAPDGAVVQLEDGTFFGSWDLTGRDITLVGNGCENTAVYGDGTGSVFQLSSGALAGMSIRAGTGTLRELSGEEFAMGGGVYIPSGDVSIESVCFSDNELNGMGAAVAALDASVLIEGCRFDDNTAEEDGGAVFGSRAHFTVNNSQFYHNHSGHHGGAVGLQGGSLSSENSIYAYSSAALQGSALSLYPYNARDFPHYGEPPHATLRHVTIHGSPFVTPGSTAISAFGAEVTLESSLLTDNAGVPIKLTDYTDHTVIRRGSAEANGIGIARHTNHVLGDTGNRMWFPAAIRAWPAYADPEGGDLRLLPQSPFYPLHYGADLGPPITTDTDGDGMIDALEVRYGLNIYADDSSDDLDADGATNLEELTAGSDPSQADSDADGVTDGAELQRALDPTNPHDQAPVAAAGSDRSALKYAAVTLDGSRSFDPNGDTLTYQWTVSDRPPTSLPTALVTPADEAIATFTPDSTGDFELTLTVSDGLTETSHSIILSAYEGVLITDPTALEAALDAAPPGQAVALAAGDYPLHYQRTDPDLIVFGIEPGVRLLGTGAGSIFDLEDGRLTLTDVELAESTVINHGAGLALRDMDPVQLDRVQFVDNLANGWGGAIHAIDSHITATDLDLVGNQAFGKGGAVYLEHTAFSVTGCRVVDNTTHPATNGSGTAGGVLYSRRPRTDDIFLSSCVFAGNQSPVSIVHLDAQSYLRLKKTAFIRNRADALVQSRTIRGSELLFAHNDASVALDDFSNDPTSLSYVRPQVVHILTDGAVPILPVQAWNDDAWTPEFLWRPALDIQGFIRDSVWDGRLGSTVHNGGWIDLLDADGSRSDQALSPRDPAKTRWSLDVDRDGMSDGWEVFFGLDPSLDDGDLDPDSDGLSNAEEHAIGTDPTEADTDLDSRSDGDEWLHHLNPLDPLDNRPQAVISGTYQTSVGHPIALDGSGSVDPNDDPLQYSWTFLSAPSTSTTGLLSDPHIAQPIFTPDARGEYALQLIVSDGLTESEPVTTTVFVLGDISVPGDFLTLGEAIESAVLGEAILLGPGDFIVSSTLTDELDVRGAGPALTRLIAEPGRSHFQISGKRLNLSGLSLVGGMGSNGGSVDCFGGELYASDVVFRDNMAVQGGAIRARGCEVMLTDTRFYDNKSLHLGGAIFAHNGGSLVWRSGRAIGNRAGSSGGVIAITGPAPTTTLSGVELTHNHAESGGGAIHYGTGGSLLLSHVTIAANTASSGGGVSFTTGRLEIMHSIFFDNSGFQLRHGSPTVPPDLLIEHSTFYRPDLQAQPNNFFTNALTDPPWFYAYNRDNPDDTDTRLTLFSTTMLDVGPGVDADGSPEDLGAYSGPDALDQGDHWLLDTDLDGMPSSWEILMGLNPAADDGGGDLDGDGLSNLDEFLEHTRADLVDTDGDLQSDYDEVQLLTDPTRASSHRPTAVVQPDFEGPIGDLATFDGTLSTDPNSDPLTFSWTLSSAPLQSTLSSADIINPLTPTPGLSPDVPGAYHLSLVVSDGALFSMPAEQVLRVAGDLQVPEDYATLAEALDAVVTEHSISIGPGTFSAGLDLGGKNVHFIGSGASNTALTSEDGPILRAIHNEALQLTDLRLTNGRALEGAGVFLQGGSVDMAGVHIMRNHAVQGAGVSVQDGLASLSSVRILDNTSSSDGSGAFFERSTAAIHQALVAGNHSTQGGGAVASSRGDLSIENVILSDNSSMQGGALLSEGSSTDTASLSITSTTATYNLATQGGFLHAYHTDVQLFNAIAVGNTGTAISAGLGVQVHAGWVWTWDNTPMSWENNLNLSHIATTLHEEDPRIDATADGQWTTNTWILFPSGPAKGNGDPTQTNADGTPMDPGAFGGVDGVWPL